MKTLLKISATMTGANGFSSQLADEFAQRWLNQNPGGSLVVRDLFADQVPHLTAERFQAFTTPATERTPVQQTAVAYSDALIAEIAAADVVVFAVPMYNFSIPSTLRAYFDHIARSGVTFRYTAEGPQGLLKNKQVYVFIARGGVYPASADTQTPYLRQFLGFLGMTDVQFIYAEGLGMGEESRAKGLHEARQAIEQWAALPEAA